MGNSQTSAIKGEKVEGTRSDGLTSSSSTTFGGSIKSRRGSKVKVFGLLGQKKTLKDSTTSTTPTAADLPPVVGINVANTSIPGTTTQTIGNVESIDEEVESHQKHDAIVRHLEFEQMEINKILRDTFCDNNDFDDDFQNNQMATSLTMMMTMLDGSHPHYTLKNDNCDIVVLKGLSSSSDSLFTDPLTPPQSTISVTAPLGQTAETCSYTDVTDDEEDSADFNINNDKIGEGFNVDRNQTHITPAFHTPTFRIKVPKNLRELKTITTTLGTKESANAATIKRKQRPLSDISIISSGDNSGILSPSTAKAILELQKRHQADKLSLLSISKTTYLELLPTDIEGNSELEIESPHEQMALHLGKKLAQVLSGNTGNSPDNGNSAGSTNIPGSPMQDNLACCNLITGTNELFNIAKAKKVELPSLSSRLVATVPVTSIEAQATTTSTQSISSADTKHLPTLQSTTLPTYPGLTSTNNTNSTTTETQSTVIISFKSSQTPVLSQPIHTSAGAYEHSQHQQQSEYSSASVTTNDTRTEAVTHTPSFTLTNSSLGSTAAQISSPLCTPRTSKNNVLKKVASFTIEKVAAGGSANNKLNNNGDYNSGMPGQLENISSKRLIFVPEKLSFAAYEKFEGQMLMKWLISSLHSNCNYLSEQDIGMLTLQYCNNLISVGVLKQISEKNDLEAFKPFEMYQWTHTEASTTSQPHTPGKLDKVTSWPYCSTPASRIPKAIQVDTPEFEKEIEFIQTLRKRLLSCTSMTDVQFVINDIFSTVEPLRRPSKRCMLITDLLNTSEATVYQFDKSKTEITSSYKDVSQEVGTQTELQTQLINEFACSNCQSRKDSLNRRDKLKIDREIQVSFDNESIENNQNKVKTAVSSSSSTDNIAAQLPAVPPCKAPPPPPPPPISKSALPPPPPPPPPIIDGFKASPQQNLSSTSFVVTPYTSTAVPPPPPPLGIHKTVSSSTPPPLPNPAEGGWFNQANTLRKTAVNPPKPMKPLYWTRIVTQHSALPKPPKQIASTNATTGDSRDSSTPSTSPDESVDFESASAPKEIWQEIDETNLDNIDEFTELFSREAVAPKIVPKIKTQVRARPIKVLDSKRSQNVGILIRSSHVDFCEIEHAIYHVDTSVVSLETLQQINKNKATSEELERIKEQGDTPLDEPEQFLLKISQISMFTERISCMVFMSEFEETATIIERKLEVVMQLSQFLTESEELKLIFAIILTLGNYMNGGNRQRGQADGFTLEILSKLKDVKSKDSQITLLHFIVRTYIGRKRKEGVQLLEIPLPIPEPSDVERATQVDFDEVKDHLAKLNELLRAKKRTTDKVIVHSTTQNIEPFKSKMEHFIKNASKQIEKLFEELNDCRNVFIDTMKFYHYAPKSGTLEQCTPNKFFEHWTNFTNDFKDIMKKEIALLWNELLKKSKDAQTRKTVKTTKVKPGGLKERIMRLNKK